MRAVELVNQFLGKAEEKTSVKFSKGLEPWTSISNKQKWFLLKLLKDEGCAFKSNNDDLMIPLNWVKDCELKGNIWLRKIRTPDVWSIRFEQPNNY